MCCCVHCSSHGSFVSAFWRLVGRRWILWECLALRDGSRLGPVQGRGVLRAWPFLVQRSSWAVGPAPGTGAPPCDSRAEALGDRGLTVSLHLHPGVLNYRTQAGGRASPALVVDSSQQCCKGTHENDCLLCWARSRAQEARGRGPKTDANCTPPSSSLQMGSLLKVRDD